MNDIKSALNHKRTHNYENHNKLNLKGKISLKDAGEIVIIMKKKMLRNVVAISLSSDTYADNASVTKDLERVKTIQICLEILSGIDLNDW